VVLGFELGWGTHGIRLPHVWTWEAHAIPTEAL